MERLDQGAAVACNLNDAEFRERRTLVRKSLLPHIMNAERTESGLKLVFSNTGALRRELEAFVELERQCCGFLSFTITQAPQSLTLLIEGPAEAAATIEMFANAVKGQTE